jgi:branched-chain amino acid transport system substrate-binding protein
MAALGAIQQILALEQTVAQIQERCHMIKHPFDFNIKRRTLLKAGLLLGAAQAAGPFVISARGETPIKIGMVDPETGTYAALGDNEIKGARLALKELNAKGGILGRPLELVVEDTAANVSQAVQKVDKLIDQDRVTFLMGAVSSAVAEADSQTAHNKRMLYMVTGGHTDPVTGSKCHWNTFRICSTTHMLAAAIAKTLVDKFGKRWYFITPDYAFGHTEQAAFAKLLKNMGGTVLGNALAPLGTTDFSSYLIAAQQTKPDALIVLTAGNDLVNTLKQATQFGLPKQMAIGGGLLELEVLAALPPEARYGWWTFEWYWNQPNVPHVQEFVANYRKDNNNEYPTARSWFGYAGLQSLALAANEAKTVDPVKVAHTLEGLVLPPQIALEPYSPTFRAGDHQLMTTLFPGEVNEKGSYPNLFNVERAVPGKDLALSVEDEGCKLDYSA